jgi:predicted enzyme related to lactoylglutathione lyase
LFGKPSIKRTENVGRAICLPLALLGALAVLGGAALAAETAPMASASLGVGPQYDGAHVYVAPDQVDSLCASLIGTFGGTASDNATVTVTPVSSSTHWRYIRTPVGPLSVFGYITPIPYPFGSERTGYLVTNLDAAIAAARAAGAELVVAPFPDPIGRDAVVRWPGGVMMQLYWHASASTVASLSTIPENRVYVSPDGADAFVKAFDAFSGGRVVQDNPAVTGAAIGRPGMTIREIRLSSAFGTVAVIVTDGHLPYPYGRDIMGYGVADLDATLAKARANGATVVAGPYTEGNRRSAIVLFPGNFVAEIHSV